MKKFETSQIVPFGGASVKYGKLTRWSMYRIWKTLLRVAYLFFDRTNKNPCILSNRYVFFPDTLLAHPESDRAFFVRRFVGDGAHYWTCALNYGIVGSLAKSLRRHGNPARFRVASLFADRLLFVSGDGFGKFVHTEYSYTNTRVSPLFMIG